MTGNRFKKQYPVGTEESVDGLGKPVKPIPRPQKTPLVRMCMNCCRSKISGKGLDCILIDDCPIHVDSPRAYSCPEHQFWSDRSDIEVPKITDSSI